jgi:hypothetical protein
MLLLLLVDDVLEMVVLPYWLRLLENKVGFFFLLGHLVCDFLLS